MGKKLIIPGADFSANAIQIATFKTVNPNTSFQIKDSTVKNVQSDSDGIYEFDGYINYTGSSSAINLFNDPANTPNTVIKQVDGLRLKSSDMHYGFVNCSVLEDISIADIDVVGNSIDIGSLFLNCVALKNIRFPKNKKIKSHGYLNNMFNGCKLLKTLDLSMIDTQDVVSMPGFIRAGDGSYIALEEINLSGWDLGSFDTSSASSYSNAFQHANKLKKVIVNDCDASTITKLTTIISAGTGLTYTQGTDSDGNTVLIGA